MAWLGVECVLELPIALAGILVALTPGVPAVLASGFLVGYATITYPAGVCFLPALLPLWWRECERHPHSRKLAILAGGAISFVSPIAGLWLWWQGKPTLMTAGGNFSPHAFIPNLWTLVKDLSWQHSSYYYFIDRVPGLAHLSVAIVCGLGLMIMAFKLRGKNRERYLPFFAALTAGIFVYCISGQETQIRRASAILVALAIGTGVLLQEILEGPRLSGKMRYVAAGAALLMLAPLLKVAHWHYRTLADQTYVQLRYHSLKATRSDPDTNVNYFKELASSPQGIKTAMHARERDRMIPIIYAISSNGNTRPQSWFTLEMLQRYYQLGYRWPDYEVSSIR
jgi:hypothetical protein